MVLGSWALSPTSRRLRGLSRQKVCGLNEAGLDSEMSGLGSSAPEALDGSSSTLPVFKSGSSLMGGSSPVENPVFFAHPALARQDGSRSEVKTTTGMGGGLSDIGEFFSANPSLCTALVEDPHSPQSGRRSPTCGRMCQFVTQPCVCLGGWVRTLKDLWVPLWGRLRWEKGFACLFR